MFTLSITKKVSSLYNIAERWGEIWEGKPKKLEVGDPAAESKLLQEMMGRSHQIQKAGAGYQLADRQIAWVDLDKQMSIMFTGSSPKDISRIPWFDRPEVRNMGWVDAKESSVDAGKKLSGNFADAKFSGTQAWVDIFTQGDRTILSIPGGNTVDFSTDTFNSRKDLLLKQFAQNNSTPPSWEAPKVASVGHSSPRVAGRGQPIRQADRPINTIPPAQVQTAWVAEARSTAPEAPKLSDQAKLDQARQDKATALAALSLVGNSQDARKPYEVMIRKADIDIQRLEPLIAQAKAAETYRWLSPERREIVDIQTTLSDMRKDFTSLMARDARWDKSVRKEMSQLFWDIKRLEGTMVSLEKWQANITRLQADIDAIKKRWFDMYGTSWPKIEQAQAEITKIKAEIVASRTSSTPIMAQYRQWLNTTKTA